MFTKQCSRCKEYKALSEFARNPLMPDGLTTMCKDCGGVDIIDYLAFYLDTPEKHYGLTAAVMVNDDAAYVEYIVGRLREANELYPGALRKMAEMLIAAVDALEE